MSRPLPSALALAALSGAAAWWMLSGERLENGTGEPSGTEASRRLADDSPRPEQTRRFSPGPSATSQPPSFLLRAHSPDWHEEVTAAPLISALLQWAEIEPDNAIAFLPRVPAAVRDSVQRELAAALIAARPLVAVKLLTALPQSQESDQMLRQAAMEYATQSPEEALTWAVAQPEPDTKALLLSAVLCVRAATDPVSAAAASLTEISAGPLQDRLVVEIAQRWTQTDAPATQRWLDSLPDGLTKTAAVTACNNPAFPHSEATTDFPQP